MPATEQTWRDLKRSHVVFGVTSVLMLLATVWMFIDDHEREWKPIQDFFQTRLETWTTQARIYESLAGDYRDGLDAREQVLAAQQAEHLNTTLLSLFLAELRFARAPQAPQDAQEYHAALMEHASATLELNKEILDLTVEEATLAKDIALANPRSASRKSELERQQKVVVKQLAELRPKLQSHFADLQKRLDQMPESLSNVTLGDGQQALEKSIRTYNESHSGDGAPADVAPQDGDDATAKDGAKSDSSEGAAADGAAADECAET